MRTLIFSLFIATFSLQTTLDVQAKSISEKLDEISDNQAALDRMDNWEIFLNQGKRLGKASAEGFYDAGTFYNGFMQRGMKLDGWANDDWKGLDINLDDIESTSQNFKDFAIDNSMKALAIVAPGGVIILPARGVEAVINYFSYGAGESTVPSSLHVDKGVTLTGDIVRDAHKAALTRIENTQGKGLFGGTRFRIEQHGLFSKDIKIKTTSFWGWSVRSGVNKMHRITQGKHPNWLLSKLGFKSKPVNNLAAIHFDTRSTKANLYAGTARLISYIGASFGAIAIANELGIVHSIQDTLNGDEAEAPEELRDAIQTAKDRLEAGEAVVIPNEPNFVPGTQRLLDMNIFPSDDRSVQKLIGNSEGYIPNEPNFVPGTQRLLDMDIFPSDDPARDSLEILEDVRPF